MFLVSEVGWGRGSWCGGVGLRAFGPGGQNCGPLGLSWVSQPAEDYLLLEDILHQARTMLITCLFITSTFRGIVRTTFFEGKALRGGVGSRFPPLSLPAWGMHVSLRAETHEL